MKPLLIAIFALMPSLAMAEMDWIALQQERKALATAIVLEKVCDVNIDENALFEFVGKFFEDHETEVLSSLDGEIMLVEFGLKDAGNLQKRAMCAAVEQYVSKHGIGVK